jgi:ATP-binding cassette subfamily F protein 3
MHEIAYEGKVDYGHNVNITYFAQNQAEKLDKTKTIYETVDDVAVGEIRKDLRSILGAFLFSGEDIEKQVGVLSGGERTRLALCQLLLSPSNLLILDEPTNHLDIESKEVLKEALQKYEGTFIIVSHDREFLNGLTNRIWDIEAGALKIHHFEIKDYLDFKLNKEEKPAKGFTKLTPENSDKEQNSKNNKDHRADKREKQRLENLVKKSEGLIAQLEQEIELCTKKINDSSFENQESAVTIFEEIGVKQKALDTAMKDWEDALTSLEEYQD